MKFTIESKKLAKKRTTPQEINQTNVGNRAKGRLNPCIVGVPGKQIENRQATRTIAPPPKEGNHASAKHRVSPPTLRWWPAVHIQKGFFLISYRHHLLLIPVIPFICVVKCIKSSAYGRGMCALPFSTNSHIKIFYTPARRTKTSVLNTIFSSSRQSMPFTLPIKKNCTKENQTWPIQKSNQNQNLNNIPTFHT